MATPQLLIDPQWNMRLETPFQPAEVNERLSTDIELRCQLVYTLMAHYKLPVREFMYFLFESDIIEVKTRAGIFLGHHSTREDPFPPATLYKIWKKRFPRCRHFLNQFIVQPDAQDIVLKESDAILNDAAYRIVLRTCTMDKIRGILNPGKLAGMYQTSAPFTWALLWTFCGSNNKYRKRKAKAARKATEEQFKWDQATEDNVQDGNPMFDGDLGSDSEWRRNGLRRNPVVVLVFVISMLVFARNAATNLFPLIFGLFLEIGGTSTRVFQTLSNAGACVSINTVERLKKIISDDAKKNAIQLMKGPTQYFCIFDNINIFRRKTQARFFNQSSIINATNAIIIALPDAHPDAPNLQTKLSNRGKRINARGEDVVPNAADESGMRQSFKGLVAHLLIAYCPGSENWQNKQQMREDADKNIASIRPLPVKKTDARPLGVFDVDEGSKQGIIDMLKKLQRTSTLSEEDWSSKTRIIAGDWFTTSNFRSARRERSGDVNSMERMEYGEDLSQLFHFALNASHMLMRLHFGTALLDPGSLEKHKGLVHRTWDIEKPNYADGKALVRHSLIARILYTLMVDEGITRWSMLSGYNPTPAQVSEFADTFVNRYAWQAHAAKAVNDDYLAHSIYFIRDALIFCEFEHAVSHADAGRVLRVLKFWALSFQGARLHNYARECLEILLRWKYELDPSLQDALEQSWFVNRWGLPGRWIAADLYIEQLNYWIKHVFIAKGAGHSLDYIIDKGSASVEAFREVSHQFARAFGNADRARRHSEVNVERDLRVLCENMIHVNLHIKTPNRQILSNPTSDSNGAAATTAKSMIFDSLQLGHLLLQKRFFEFVRTSCWDSAVGYPFTDSFDGPPSYSTSSTTVIPDVDVLLNKSGYDNSNQNPISFDEFMDIDDGDDLQQRCVGCGSLGGEVDF